LSLTVVVPYGSAMGQIQPRPPTPEQDPRRPTIRQVGRVSQFLGSRLLMIWLITGVLGLGFLIYAGVKVWLVVSRGSLGAEIGSLVVAGALAFALLSISGSARRNGLKYLQGERSVSSDLARFVARRLQRRRQTRRR
jgi:hypothetical protein